MDAIESVLYQKALNGDTIAMIFYLKAHRLMYRDKVSIDINQVKSEIEERMAQLGVTGKALARAIPALRD